MNIVKVTGKPELARVYVASLRNDPNNLVEFVDACSPTLGDRLRKWVIIVSTQLGCPVNCLMCDAGGSYRGNLSSAEMLSQVQTVIADNGLDPNDCAKFKVQFARMGEPALNPQVMTALKDLSGLYPGVIPCIATIGPEDSSRWFSELLIVRDLFRDFQLQFSVNSTDEALRDAIMPYPKMPLAELAGYGQKFYRFGQRKVVLNFALQPQWPLDGAVLHRIFDPKFFAVKLTPTNPTATGSRNNLDLNENIDEINRKMEETAGALDRQGFLVIRSVGELEENKIGSNCGQAVRSFVDGMAV
ncbi:radical SAM protein [candidate division TA06 bacterium]|uniref:Radical SAM protein n=1 Tax=candidate division TA06 bacterium TaxID=2250710 RepID=A0A933IBS4_UNCT6|nr:radical SAM protein [candidate division TA06 bacterium]